MCLVFCPLSFLDKIRGFAMPFFRIIPSKVRNSPD